jgi:molybdopterin-binding protein
MQLSTRNQLRGIVQSVRTSDLMAEIAVDVGGQTVTSIITADSAERLRLREGQAVTVFIKATEVMVGKD